MIEKNGVVKHIILHVKDRVDMASEYYMIS